MARGGKRAGTPGKAYTNRTDLNVVRAGQSGVTTAAAGGQTAPPAQAPQQPVWSGPTPDQVPRLDDPTMRPDEPVTTGLPVGAGGGLEALGAVPPNPSIQRVQAAYLANPTPELRRAIMFLSTQNAL